MVRCRFGGVVKYNGDKTLKYREVDCNVIGYFTVIALDKDSRYKIHIIWMIFVNIEVKLMCIVKVKKTSCLMTRKENQLIVLVNLK